MATNVKNLEDLLRFPASHIHDRIYNALDVPAKRRCLAVSTVLRKFILERSEAWEREERGYNWFAVKRPACLMEINDLGRKTKVVSVIIDESSTIDIFILFEYELMVYRDFNLAGTISICGTNKGTKLLWTYEDSLFFLRHSYRERSVLHYYCTKTFTEQRRQDVKMNCARGYQLRGGLINARKNPLRPVRFIRDRHDPLPAIASLLELMSILNMNEEDMIETSGEFALVAKELSGGNVSHTVLMEVWTITDQNLLWRKEVQFKDSYTYPQVMESPEHQHIGMKLHGRRLVSVENRPPSSFYVYVCSNGIFRG